MSRGVNKVILVGHVGQDVELKYTPSGVAVATFSLATSESWKDQDGSKQEKTTWHNIVVWRKLAEIAAEYVKKGARLYVEGKIDNQTYEKDGVKHYTSKIVIDQMIILSSNRQVDDVTGSEPPPEKKGKEDDLPF
jgi:single-strand DNA-binding protein